MALATLMHELLLTRIFSVTMWYHFAFVAISVAMFGMTVGALLVYLLPNAFAASSVKLQLAIAAIAFPILMVFSFLTELSIPFLVHPSVVALYAIAFTYAVISLPFVASGVCVCLALSRFGRSVSQLYAADLLGAALGCLLLIYVLRLTDGPTAVLVVAFLGSLGGVFFALDVMAPRVRRFAIISSALLGIVAAGHTVLVWREFPVLRILYTKGGFEARPLYEKWNSYSRVQVTGEPDVPRRPYARTLSPAFPADRRVRELRMDIDVNASTAMTAYSGRPDEIEHLKYDVTNIAYYVRPLESVLVVGTGGGRDILGALAMGARAVTGVEINRDIIRTVNGRFGDFTGHLNRDPRVQFVNDEARSYIAGQKRQFDIIQISLIDTWAATAAGAFALSENSLYTIEGWNIFLRHLSDRGILSVCRWFTEGQPGEIYRTVSLASASLGTLGIEHPRDHMLIVRSRPSGVGPTRIGVGTLLVSRSPFTAADVDRLEQAVAKLQFEIVLSPRFALDDTFAQLASGRDQEQFVASFPLNIAPPTDDSPFFFHMLRLRDIGRVALFNRGDKSSPNTVAVFVLAALLLTVVGLSLLCIVVPLAVVTDRAPLRRNASLLLFFASIGLGFMLIETSQMQRLIIVLGHPTYALSVVLCTLLISSGIGSFLTRGVAPDRSLSAGTFRLAGLLLVLGLFGVFTPLLTHSFEASPAWMRIGVSIFLLSPAGVLMGMAFPMGMKLAASRSESMAAWLWGVNGAFSVCASVLSVVIALAASISAAFWVGCAAYVVAFLSFRHAASPARQTEHARDVRPLVAPHPGLVDAPNPRSDF